MKPLKSVDLLASFRGCPYSFALCDAGKLS